jgi:putative addiction module killer protein
MELADKRARVAVLRRIDRLSEGNFGEHRFLRDGLWELKIDVGPGYCVYYAQEGKTLILLLCAGAKRTQRQDIARAVEYWNDHQSRS